MLVMRCGRRILLDRVNATKPFLAARVPAKHAPAIPIPSVNVQGVFNRINLSQFDLT
jgi:hypothetical protein